MNIRVCVCVCGGDRVCLFAVITVLFVDNVITECMCESTREEERVEECVVGVVHNAMNMHSSIINNISITYASQL